MDANQHDPATLDNPNAKADDVSSLKPARTRRTFSKALKRQMVEVTLDGNESVSVVARRYNVNANQLFKWRNLYQEGLLHDDGEPTTLLPITVLQNEQAIAATPTKQPTKASADTGCLEVTFPRGQRMMVTGTVCPQTLRTALDVLSQ